MATDISDTGSDYRRKREREGERSRKLALVGRDIGKIPPIANIERRAAGRADLRRFCDDYFSEVFTLAWSDDHLRVLARAQECVLRGGQFALAMPRGSGKTSICEVAATWAVLYGHRRFVLLIGASEAAGYERLDTIVSHFETNERLLEDFPEVCYPIAKLEGIAHRCKGQLCQGERTQITWTQTEIVLPSVLHSAASGAIVKVAGITGRIRGMKFQRPDGKSVRPDFVIVDDPQTDESARSLSQCATRERTLAGAVLGLGGPAQKISAIMPCTVIRPGDVADNILDRGKHPEWNGERLKLMKEMPTSKLWDRYGELRAESLRRWGDIRDATEFYQTNRAEMDAGAVVSWPARHLPDELSAVQYAMNLKIQDEAAFQAEYQNEPIQDRGTDDAGVATVDDIAMKVNGYRQGQVPVGASILTAFIDVQQKLLYWVVVAWQDNFTGHVVDYGAFPDQQREYFSLNDAQRTLSDIAGGAGLEGSIYAGLEQLTALLLGTEWTSDDGTPSRVGLCLVDASWGMATDVVYQYCRQSVHAAQLLPSHGRYVGPTSRPFHEWAKKPGDRLGLNWRIPGAKGRRAVRHALYDTNYWKSFIHSRIAQSMGDPGCLSLFGRDPARHRMFAEHLTSEHRQRVQGSSRVADLWALRPNARDNHLFDCVVGCAVAASILGVSLQGMTAGSGLPKKRERIRLSDLQRRRA